MFFQGLCKALLASSLILSGVNAGNYADLSRHNQHRAENLARSMHERQIESIESRATTNYRFYNNQTESECHPVKKVLLTVSFDRRPIVVNPRRVLCQVNARCQLRSRRNVQRLGAN